MSDPILPLAVWEEGTLQNDVPANDNALRIEALIRPCLGEVNSPPITNDGDVYVVGPAPSGAFSTFDPDDLTIYRGGNWYAWAPVEGLPLIINDARMIYSGSSGWVSDPSIGGGAVDSVNGQTGVVVLDAGDVGAATAAQGTTADSAVQPGDLEAIAFSGALLDATDFPGGTTNFLRADGTFAAPPGGGGGGSPGGADTNVQYNASGSFGGDSTFTFNATTKALGASILNTIKGTDIARAGTTDIWAATGNFVHLTGTTTITSFGANTAGFWRIVRFAGAGTLTHNATSLILPGGANITTAANDTAIVVGEGGSNARVVMYSRASGLPIVNPAVAITGWTPSLATASPNNTNNVSRMLASGGSTNQFACIQAKGNGGFLVQLPDGAAAGGDVRGTYSFDGQSMRSGPDEVASGQFSVTFGAYCKASAIGAVGIGYSAFATAQYAVSIGHSNACSGDYSSGSGHLNTVDGEESWTPGGFAASTRGCYGAGARASGYSTAIGDTQDRVFIMRANTANATQTTVTTNGGGAATNNQVVLPDNSSFIIKATVNARRNSNGDAKSWDVTAHITRGANAAATAMVAAATLTQIAASAGASGWALAVDADTTNGCLRVRVTGAAATDLRWSTSVYSCNEVVG